MPAQPVKFKPLSPMMDSLCALMSLWEVRRAAGIDLLMVPRSVSEEDIQFRIASLTLRVTSFLPLA